MATVDFINIVNGNATCNIESTQGIVLERITFIIKIKSKENSFINSWFKSFHKRFDQYHLNDSSMQVLNTRFCKVKA